MKATINAKGALLITPETVLEEYALQNWNKNFRSYEPKEGESSLIIMKLKEKKTKKDKKAKKGEKENVE